MIYSISYVKTYTWSRVRGWFPRCSSSQRDELIPHAKERSARRLQLTQVTAPTVAADCGRASPVKGLLPAIVLHRGKRFGHWRKRFVSRCATNLPCSVIRMRDSASRGAREFRAKDNLLRNSSWICFVREVAPGIADGVTPIDHDRAIYARELTVAFIRESL